MSHKSLSLAKTILSRALGSNPVWRFGYEFGNFQPLSVRSYQCYLQNDKGVMEILLPRPYRESCLTNHMHMDNVSRWKGPLQLLNPTAVSVGPALSRLTVRVSPLSVQTREHMLPSKKGQLITGVATFCAFFFFFQYWSPRWDQLISRHTYATKHSNSSTNLLGLYSTFIWAYHKQILWKQEQKSVNVAELGKLCPWNNKLSY